MKKFTADIVFKDETNSRFICQRFSENTFLHMLHELNKARGKDPDYMCNLPCLFRIESGSLIEHGNRSAKVETITPSEFGIKVEYSAVTSNDDLFESWFNYDLSIDSITISGESNTHKVLARN